MARRGINLVGHITSNLGLGVAARNTAALLDATATPFVAVDVPTTMGSSQHADAFAERLWTKSAPAPYSVNLFHLNPPELKRQVQSREKWLALDGHLNAVVPFWELSRLPAAWVDVIARMDVVLAPTAFVAGLVRDAGIAEERIVAFPQGVEIPSQVVRDRTRWGFGEDEVVFVASFDLNSDLARKNPGGTIAAFNAMRSAAPHAKTRLLIKVNNVEGEGPKRRLEQLRALAEQAVEIRSDSLPYADVLSLYASADVYVSLHRAEGLGLGLLESMALGVPVLATAYSGNLDFMTPSDSRLVGYKLVPVADTSIGSYDPRVTGDGQMWAEPDVDDAARGMLELLDAEHRARLARAARAASIAMRDDPRRRAAIETLLERGLAAPARSPLSDLQRLPGWVWRARSLAGSLKRRIRTRS